MRGENPARLRRKGRLAVAAVLASLVLAAAALAQVVVIVPPLTGANPPMENLPADPIPQWDVSDVRKMRAYPEQPPVIPHSIDGYQLTVNANRCLSCHRREYTVAAGAPMISITHFMTREGQMLADVSPRRYFCTACHVPQAEVSPLVVNTFRDMIELGVQPLGAE